MTSIDEEIRSARQQAERAERKRFLKAQGCHLAKLRKEHGYNQFDFAQEVGLVINSVSKIERGLADTLIFTLHKIAKVLKLSLAEVVDFEQQHPAEMTSPHQQQIAEITKILQTLDENTLRIVKKQIEAFDVTINRF